MRMHAVLLGQAVFHPGMFDLGLNLNSIKVLVNLKIQTHYVKSILFHLSLDLCINIFVEMDCIQINQILKRWSNFAFYILMWIRMTETLKKFVYCEVFWQK